MFFGTVRRGKETVVLETRLAIVYDVMSQLLRCFASFYTRKTVLFRTWPK